MAADHVESTVVESTPLAAGQKPNTEYTERLKAEVAKFDVNAEEVRLGVKSLALVVVKDTASRDAAYLLVKSANKARILAERRCKEVLAPLKELIDGVKTYANTFLVEPLEKAISRVDGIILAFDAIEKKRKEEEAKSLELERLRIAEEAAQKALEIKNEGQAAIEQVNTQDFATKQKAIDAMPPGIAKIKAQRELNAMKGAAVAKVEVAVAQAITVTEIDKSLALSDVKGKQEDLDAKVKGNQKVWLFTVVDPEKVPAQYKVVSDALIRAAIKDGARGIPGVKIYEEAKIRH